MSDPPEDPPESTGTPTLPKIPWPILLRYHLRKALQWRPWRTEAPSFELGKQFGSACRHFLKAYFWIMLPVALGWLLGIYTRLWNDNDVSLKDPDTWPGVMDFVEGFPRMESPLASVVLLPLYLPFTLSGHPEWLYLIYAITIFAWIFANLLFEPDYNRWVPGIVALQIWATVMRYSDLKIITCSILISYTATAAVLTAYLGWWRPRRLLHEIDTERDLMLEDRMDEAMTEQGADSEPP